MDEAVCVRCGGGKDLPLGRCGGCGHLPLVEEREISLLASTRMLAPSELAHVRERIRRGERLNPSSGALERARALLRGESEPDVHLTPRQVAGLVALNLLVTPMLGWAAWMRLRTRPGPAARQAFLATAPISAALAGAWLAWAI